MYTHMVFMSRRSRTCPCLFSSALGSRVQNIDRLAHQICSSQANMVVVVISCIMKISLSISVISRFERDKLRFKRAD